MTPTSGLSRVEHGWSATELWMAKKPSRLSWGPVHSAVLWDQSCRNFRKVESGPHFSTSDVDPSPGFVIDPGDPKSYDIILATWIISGIVIWGFLKIIMKNEVSWTWLLFFTIFCHCPWQWASYPVHESTTVAVSHTTSFEHPLNHPVLAWGSYALVCCFNMFQPHPSSKNCACKGPKGQLISNRRFTRNNTRIGNIRKPPIANIHQRKKRCVLHLLCPFFPSMDCAPKKTFRKCPRSPSSSLARVDRAFQLIQSVQS